MGRDLTPALYRAALALGRTRNAGDVVRAAIAETQRAAGLEAVALYILDPEGRVLLLKEFAGTSLGLQERLSRLAVSEEGPIAQALGRLEVATLAASDHPSPEISVALAEHGFRHVTVVPVMGQDRALGILMLASREPIPLSPDETALVRAVGGLVGMALESAALRERLVAQQDRLRALAGGILRAREEEARRIAHELHDEAGQLLAALHITLDDLAAQVPAQDASFKRFREVLDQVEAQLRRLARELRPTILDDLGLGPALEWLAQGLAERRDVTITIDAPEGRLTPELETALYRIVQEALTNVVKHADARRVSITLVRKEASAVVVIEDDGRGFDPEAVRAGALGFTGMRERVELVGGRLTVETSPGAGTTLVAEVHVAPGMRSEEDDA
jgi:signal transduction histidine kinase